jgi:predicted nucleic acid-binding Zn ribbon protein
MKDEPLKECPNCHQQGVKRLLGTGAGLIFKGSGFYITDYKNKSGGSGGGESSGTKSSDSKSTGGGGDGKSSGASSISS